MKNRRYVFCLLSLVFILCLAHASAHADIKGTIKSASEYDYPPLSIVTEDGKADGFSVELLREALSKVHMNVEFKVGPWDEIKNELRDGKIQVLPLVARTPEREAIYDFTFTYLTLHGAIFVREGDTRIESVDDLADKEIIVMAGDAAAEYVERERISPHVIAVESYEDAMKLLASGKHDAVIAQRLMGILLLKNMGLTEIVPVEYRLEKFKQEFSFAVREGDKKLLSLLNEGLSIVVADGTFDRLHEKWFGPILGPRLWTKDTLHLALMIAGPAITIVLILFVFFLRREVKRKTEGLKQEIEERRKTEETLQQSASALLEAQQLAHIGSWSWTVETDTVAWSKELYEIAGRDPQLPAPSFAEHPSLYEKESWECLSKAVEKATGEGKPYELELNMVRPDGQIVCTSTRGRAEKDKSGRVIRLYGTVQDITDRKKAEDEQKRSAELLAIVLDSIDALIYVADMNTYEVLFINKYGRAVWGDISGQICWQKLQKDQTGPCAFCTNKHLLDQDGKIKDAFIWEFQNTVTQKWYYIYDRAIYWLDGSIVRIEIATDISKRKKIEEELKFRSEITEQVNAAVITTGLDFKINWVNKAFNTLYGYSSDEVIGQTPDFLNSDPFSEEIQKDIYQKLSSGEVWIGEALNMKKDGTTFQCLMDIFPLKDEDGNTFAYAGNQRDITERKEAEQQIEASLKEKEVLLQEIHHRVKNNFTVIMSLLSLQGANIKDEGVKAIFRDSTNRLKSMSLVHDMLYKSEDLTKIDFGDYIRQLTQYTFRTYMITSDKIIINVDIDDIYLNTDTSILIGMIVNELVSNAMEHAFPGDRRGEIWIAMKKSDTNNGNKHEIIVKDNGVGLPEGLDIRKTDTLGLKMVTAMVERQLNGSIEVKRDGGTEYKLRCKELLYKKRI